ncbi:MAG: hypothetical protein RJA63_568 [Pseudomonadota bacterium]|jgi:hypothetical protein
MTNNVSSAGKTAPAFPAISDLKKLRDAVQAMDNVSQSACGKIITLADLALRQLETPECYRKIDEIAQLFDLIRDQAFEVRDYINGRAEDLGCNYKDAASERRNIAWRAARADVVGGESHA